MLLTNSCCLVPEQQGQNVIQIIKFCKSNNIIIFALSKRLPLIKKSMKEVHGEHQICRTYVVVLESTMKTPYQNNQDKRHLNNKILQIKQCYFICLIQRLSLMKKITRKHMESIQSGVPTFLC